MWNITGTFLVRWIFMLQLQWAAPLNYVTQVSKFFVVMINEFFPHPTNIAWLKLFFFFTHGPIFVKMSIDYFFTILILFKSCFNKFVSSICNFKNNNWFTKSIINTNKLVSKTRKNAIFILFWIRSFITFNTF